MLRLAGESSIGLEKIEHLVYAPGVKDTGDLEAATKTITATSEASGTGNADYSSALTLPKPDDARLTIKNIAARLAVTIDSFDTATHLYCRVYVDQQDADHRLFDMDWTSTGAKLAAQDLRAGLKETIFDALKDGASHTFYFFFWIDQANNAVISLVQLWEGVGTSSTGWTDILELQHTGLIWWNVNAYPQGTGTFTAKGYIVSTISASPTFALWSNDYIPSSGNVLFLCPDKARIHGRGSVATDLNCIGDTTTVLRSEQ